MDLWSTRTMCEYHYWANHRLLDAAERLAPDAFARDLGGSLGSLRAVFAHLLAVDAAWIGRLSGVSPERTRPQDLPDARAARELWRPLEEDVRALVGRLDEAELSRMVAFRALSGLEYELPVRACLTHLFNHGTYHRGQVADRLRTLGEAPPATDLPLFLRDRPF